VVALVGLIDGMNRIRFAGEPELVGEWVNVSDVRATPVRSTAEDGGESGPTSGGWRSAAGGGALWTVTPRRHV
jgi:hypothetical protein